MRWAYLTRKIKRIILFMGDIMRDYVLVEAIANKAEIDPLRGSRDFAESDPPTEKYLQCMESINEANRLKKLEFEDFVEAAQLQFPQYTTEHIRNAVRAWGGKSINGKWSYRKELLIDNFLEWARKPQIELFEFTPYSY